MVSVFGRLFYFLNVVETNNSKYNFVSRIK
jgi:hypothetical protein